jgi:ABC-type antimicrobial peptide transport system ATPase subunit
VAVAVLLSYPTHLQLELQQAVLVALAIYSQVELVAHQLLPTQAEQVVAVQVLSLLVLTHQATQVELVEMAEAEAEALTTQAHQVLAATAYFIFITKEIKWQHTQ